MELYKKTKNEESLSSSNNVISINGKEITIVRSDGYINATMLCKSGGKKWPHYHSNKSTKEYITFLESILHLTATEMIETTTGGIPRLQGTWVHPTIAVHLASWITPHFFYYVLLYCSHHINILPPQPNIKRPDPLFLYAFDLNVSVGNETITKPFKVGITSNVVQRAKQFRNICPLGFMVLVLPVQSYQDERRAHELLSQYRLGGEVFNIDLATLISILSQMVKMPCSITEY